MSKKKTHRKREIGSWWKLPNYPGWWGYEDFNVIEYRYFTKDIPPLVSNVFIVKPKNMAHAHAIGVPYGYLYKAYSSDTKRSEIGLFISAYGLGIFKTLNDAIESITPLLDKHGFHSRV